MADYTLNIGNGECRQKLEDLDIWLLAFYKNFQWQSECTHRQCPRECARAMAGAAKRDLAYL